MYKRQPEDALAVARIFVNTNIAAAGGAVAVTLASQLFYRRLDLTLILNGALAGLVSITAEPVAPTAIQALSIGAVGGVLMMAGARALEQLLLDDVVGAIPVHLVAGIWGTAAVVISNPEAVLWVQLAGAAGIGAFAFATSIIIWTVLRRTIGIRLKRHHENAGGDMVEVGMRAYNIV